MRDSTPAFNCVQLRAIVLWSTVSGDGWWVGVLFFFFFFNFFSFSFLLKRLGTQERSFGRSTHGIKTDLCIP
jgi:hypothetical protein